MLNIHALCPTYAALFLEPPELKWLCLCNPDPTTQHHQKKGSVRGMKPCTLSHNVIVIKVSELFNYLLVQKASVECIGNCCSSVHMMMCIYFILEY